MLHIHKCALYVDADNLLAGLADIDQRLAVRVAREPRLLLEGLTTQHTLGNAQRRWLVARCYLNPNAFIPRGDERIYLSSVRAEWVRAGFEVVDCPPLTARGKNAADIRIVIDALSALDGSAHIDQFVIVSADADFTPLLYRLRAADRHTSVVVTGPSTAAYTSVADLTVSADDVAALYGHAMHPMYPDAFRDLLRRALDDSTHPVPLAALAKEVRNSLGKDIVNDTNWFGHGGLGAALDALDMTNTRRNALHVWDITRHAAPGEVSAHAQNGGRTTAETNGSPSTARDAPHDNVLREEMDPVFQAEVLAALREIRARDPWISQPRLEQQVAALLRTRWPTATDDAIALIGRDALT